MTNTVSKLVSIRDRLELLRTAVDDLNDDFVARPIVGRTIMEEGSNDVGHLCYKKACSNCMDRKNYGGGAGKRIQPQLGTCDGRQPCANCVEREAFGEAGFQATNCHYEADGNTGRAHTSIKKQATHLQRTTTKTTEQKQAFKGAPQKLLPVMLGTVDAILALVEQAIQMNPSAAPPVEPGDIPVAMELAAVQPPVRGTNPYDSKTQAADYERWRREKNAEYVTNLLAAAEKLKSDYDALQEIKDNFTTYVAQQGNKEPSAGTAAGGGKSG